MHLPLLKVEASAKEISWSIKIGSILKLYCKVSPKHRSFVLSLRHSASVGPGGSLETSP